MPDVRNCRRCGRMYNYIGGPPLCQDCRQQDEEDFKRVKEYLYDNPGSSIIEVSNVLEISVQKIKGYLKEGRLEIVGDEANMILECESCGKSIKSGRYCDECTKNLKDGIKSAVEKMGRPASQESETKRSSGGMKYIHKK